MVNIPVFPDSTPEGFYERLLASKALPDSGRPDPQKMAAFLSRHPETGNAMKIIKQYPPSPGFDDSTFYGLNAFLFTNSAGTIAPVRWIAVPDKLRCPRGPGPSGRSEPPVRRPDPGGCPPAVEVAVDPHHWCAG